MYTSEGTTLLRLKDGKFEVRKTLSRGQWGATQDDAGRVYRNTNSAALFVDIVPTPYYARNPHMMRTRGSYETLDTGDLNTDVADPADARREPRLSGRRPAAGQDARRVHGRGRADGLSRRSAAGGAARQRVPRRAGRQPGQPRSS